MNEKGGLQKVVVHIEWFDKLPCVIRKDGIVITKQLSEAVGNEAQTFLSQIEEYSGTLFVGSWTGHKM